MFHLQDVRRATHNHITTPLMESWRKHATIANKLLAAGQTDHALSALLRAWASIGADSKTLRLGLILNAEGLFERCFGFNPHYIISLLNDEERRRSMYAHALEWLRSGSERRYEEAGRHCELLLFGAHAFWIGAMLQSSKDASFRVIANINASPTLSSWAMSGLEDKSSAVAAAWKCRVSSELTDLKDAPAMGRRLLVWEPFPFADTLRGIFLKELAACASAASADISPRWVKLMAVIVESRTLVESNYVGLFDRKRNSGSSSFRMELETQRSATECRNEHDEDDGDASCGFDLSHFNSLSPPTRAVRLDDLDDARMLSKPFAVWGVDLHDLRDLNKESGPVEVTATSAGGDSSGDFLFASEDSSSASVQVLASGRADAVVVWAETLFSPPPSQREEDGAGTTRGNASGWSCAPHVAKKMTACTHLQPLHEWQTAHFLTVPKLSQRSEKIDGATEPNTIDNNGETMLGSKEEEEEEEFFDVDVGVKVVAGERISVSGVMGDEGLRLTVKRANTQEGGSSQSGDAVHHEVAISKKGTGGNGSHAELDKECPTEILCTTQDSATKPLTLDYHCPMMNDGTRNRAYNRAIVRAVERCIEQKRSRRICQQQEEQQQPVQYEEGKTGNAQMTRKVELTETLIDSVSTREDTRCFVKDGPLSVRVLDIGSGSGLLGLMAARAVNATNGDKSVLNSTSDLASPEVAVADVVCCEKEQLLANLSAEIIPVNGYREEIRIAATLSSNLTAEMLGWEERNQEKPEERPGGGGADLVVTEIFGDAVLSESVLPSMRHAIDHLLKKREKKDGKVAAASVPAGFRVMAAMALAPEWLPQQAALKPESELGLGSVHKCNSPDSSSSLETTDAPKPPFVWFGDALAAMAAHTEVPITPIAASTLRWVTPPAVLLEMDMLNPSLSGERTVRMPTTGDSFDCAGSHRAVVLVHWFELQMDDETVLTTAPCGLPAMEERKSNAHKTIVMRAKCWKQSALFLPDLQLRPVEVESHATGNALDKAPPSATTPIHSRAGPCDIPGAFSVRARFHRDRLHFDVRADK